MFLDHLLCVGHCAMQWRACFVPPSCGLHACSDYGSTVYYLMACNLIPSITLIIKRQFNQWKLEPGLSRGIPVYRI